MGSNPQTDFLEDLGEYRYGFKDPETYVFKSRKGLSREIVEQISAQERRASMDAGFPTEGFGAFHAASHPDLGAGFEPPQPG